ncbi:trafficking protein particle complex 4 [Rhinolophus ferrumequinum]|uniref:Trafficking protein particle complex subunit n=1 Tax=Rhinolophus ferrumequinum TaxID=59479 RepID=A0A7J7WAV9_RHIFE|nr:trafficking protein particle complex 4 [Rhinolophus ferrumequinum]
MKVLCKTESAVQTRDGVICCILYPLVTIPGPSPGIKFVVLADPRQAGIDSLLRKIYEIYSDFALKNPFYSLEMPIRCELFDQNLKLALEVAEKAGTFGPGS